MDQTQGHYLKLKSPLFLQKGMAGLILRVSLKRKQWVTAASPFAVKVWQRVQLRMSLPYYEKWVFRQMTMIFMSIFLVVFQLMDHLPEFQWQRVYTRLFISCQLITP